MRLAGFGAENGEITRPFINGLAVIDHFHGPISRTISDIVLIRRLTDKYINDKHIPMTLND
jgi:hypothetical protein